MSFELIGLEARWLGDPPNLRGGFNRTHNSELLSGDGYDLVMIYKMETEGIWQSSCRVLTFNTCTVQLQHLRLRLGITEEEAGRRTGRVTGTGSLLRDCVP